MSEMEMDVYCLQGVFLLLIARGESEQRQTFLDVPLRSHARWGNGGTWLVTWYSVVLPNPRANRGSINRPRQQDIACQLAFIGIMTMDDILMNGSGMELFLASVCCIASADVGLLPRWRGLMRSLRGTFCLELPPR